MSVPRVERATGDGERGGSMLLELLVAMACTGLIVAAVFGLLVESARTFAGRRDRLDATARVRAAVRVAEETLAAAGAGLEGTRAVAIGGEGVATVELGDAWMQAILPARAAVEVEPEAGGWLRAADVGAFEVGDPVVGLGVGAGDGPPDSLPAGTVAAVVDDPPGGLVRIAWAPPEAARIDSEGEPRALLPIVIRELGLRAVDGGLQWRRRDRGSRWQPIVDGLSGVAFRIVGTADPGPPAAGARVEVEASAPVAGAPDVRARVGVRIR